MPPDPQEWALAQSRQPGLSAPRGPDGDRGLVPLGDTTPAVGGDRRPFFARLLAAGTGGQYSFVEVQQSPSAPGTWVTVPGGVVGPASGAGGAWEPNGSAGLMTDATAGAGQGLIVLLMPSGGNYGAAYAVVGAGCCGPAGTGTGTGTGGGGGGTVTVPCSSSPVPTTLHITLHNVSNFACVDGAVVALVYEATGLGQWWGHNVPIGTDGLGGTIYFNGYVTCGVCVGGGCSDSTHNWGLAATLKNGTAANAPTNTYNRDSTAVNGSFTQSPFVITFNGPAGTYSQTNTCGGVGATTGALNFTVTP